MGRDFGCTVFRRLLKFNAKEKCVFCFSVNLPKLHRFPESIEIRINIQPPHGRLINNISFGQITGIV